jgi:predicted transcriptional regulator
MSPGDADNVLEEVLELLDVAERTYTENANHPLWEIYEEKAITLMARRRYEDALQIFRSLPGYRLSDSLQVMAQYAANMTGQEYKPGDEQATQSQYDDLRPRLARLEQLTASLVAVVSGSGEAEGDAR